VDDVLDLAAAQSGRQQFEFATVDAAAALDDAWAPLAAQAGAHGIALDTRWPTAAVCVRADPSRLRQTLSNLLSNAIKYNRDGGTVRVCARVADGMVEIDIADDGAGLQPEQLPRLFNAFERLDAPSRGVPGTGLGLTLSRQLVESMGGTIGVASEPGTGTTFTVRLQAA
jgi:signal transduction histidine kinase